MELIKGTVQCGPVAPEDVTAANVTLKTKPGAWISGGSQALPSGVIP